MVEAIAHFLGVESDFLMSDAGMTIFLVITATLVYVVLKAVFNWFSGLFMK